MVKRASEKMSLTELEKARALGRAEAVAQLNLMFETCVAAAEQKPDFNQNELKTAKDIQKALLIFCPKILGVELKAVVTVGNLIMPKVCINIPFFRESLKKTNFVDAGEWEE